MKQPNPPATSTPPSNFIRHIIDQDLASGKNGKRVATRFPPEPNGYLHIGHAKSICLNFGLAQSYSGTCNLRMDDTNPEKESEEYERSIREDVNWLGFEWNGDVRYASNYFEQIYQYAEQLIERGLAFVCELTADQMREYRGNLKDPGKPSPFRDRSVAENLDLFRRMRKGEFAEGTMTLRAKIDMASPNINLRDPAVYRIKKVHHHQTGDAWPIYPMYDYAHCISDMIEGITHSICTLEFEDHRPLYDWYLKVLETPCHPQQIEFSRLNVNYTVMSKRKLLQLVNEKLVDGWDDPRMPTIRGMRRRGITAKALRDFCERVGVTKKENCIDIATLEHSIREDLDQTAPRRFAVLNPVKLVIENFPEGKTEELEVANHPSKPEMGMRKLAFTREVYIDSEDFDENPPADFHRLKPGGEVRLRFGYAVQFKELVKDSSGKIKEVRVTYDPQSGHGKTADGRKIKGIIHWVSATESVPATVRLYDRLFKVENPDAGDADYRQNLNADSKLVCTTARLEKALSEAKPEERFQFERLGYFVADRVDCRPGQLVFNRTVTLRDGWAKKPG